MIKRAMQPGLTFIAVLVVVLCMGNAPQPVSTPQGSMPWAANGLTMRRAAEHLLNRFSWGATPESIDDVCAKGLDQWFEEQLSTQLDDANLKARLRGYTTLTMSTADIARIYPPPGKVILELMREGKFSRTTDILDTNNKTARREALRYAYENGYRPQKELLGQLFAQKLVRAVYTRNQLQDVMTDFWMNHFTVSALKTPARNYIMTYERDAIRPNALGSFRTLLMSTAKHPAMLVYLDNVQSTAAEGCPTLLSTKVDSLKNMGGIRGWFARRKIAAAEERGAKLKAEMTKGVPEEFKAKKGLNENYAREVMELHTLGVNGGYSQADVTELARALTGWSMLPYGLRNNADRIMELIEKTKAAGTVVQGDFLFRADAHDARAKTVLGRNYAAGRGLDEGEEILGLLAEHPSTARHIARKLCVRFVSDDPPNALVERVAGVFITSHGDIKQLLRCIVQSSEFWSAATCHAKIKTPFELVVSSLRVLHADIRPTKEMYDWITRLGQQVYAAPAPTGFADVAQPWVNAGSLLNRMNYGLSVSSQGINGVTVDLVQTLGNEEPASNEAAFHTCFAHFLPERSSEESWRLLSPQLSSSSKGANAPSMKNQKPQFDLMNDDDLISDDDLETSLDYPQQARSIAHQHTSSTLQRIAGIVLGSPEFQRR